MKYYNFAYVALSSLLFVSEVVAFFDLQAVSWVPFLMPRFIIYFVNRGIYRCICIETVANRQQRAARV